MIVGWILAGLLLLALALLWRRSHRLAARLAECKRNVQDVTQQRDSLQAVFDAVPDYPASKTPDGVHISERQNAEEAIREANERAAAAARVKSDFFANMSHEIRTPMNAVIGLSNLLLKTGLTTHQRGYLSKIQQAAGMLLEIVNDILDFSKLEAGRFGFEQTAFEPDEILDRVSNLIGGRAAAKGLELIFNIDPRLNFTLVGDPMRLSQIFINFVSNAVKFTEQGEVELIVEIREQTDTDVLLYCGVRDTGIGLNAAQRSQLFQPFQQADNSITRRFGGTGLGLVICKSLAEAMGGEVGIESVPGLGSTFWFTARLGKGPGNTAATLDPALRGLPVLVVDDHRRARDVVGAMVNGMGFAVGKAGSGREAVAAIAGGEALGEPYALILLDADMPEFDGFETAAEINSLGLDPTPRIIMMIGAWGEAVADEARQVGVDYVLPKPFTPSLLLNLVSHALRDPEGGSRRDCEVGMPLMSSTPAAWRGRHILLVEDNELNQEVATGLLAEMGFVVDLAKDGAIGVDAVLNRAPEYFAAVLMDMQMPVMDGLTATEAIRRSDIHAALPVIAMTANAVSEDRERCLAAGMNDHVAKPVEPEVLRRVLLHWIGGEPDLPDAAGEAAALAPASGMLTPLLLAGAVAMPEITGIDTDSGLRRMMGNAEKYLGLLRKFAERHEIVRRELGTALDDDNRETAELVAHTLRGVAGTIGADLLASQARQVEAQLRAGAAPRDIAAELNLLGGMLDALIAELHAKLPQPVAAPRRMAAVAPDRERVVTASRKFAALLRQSDVAAISFLTENSELLRDTFAEHFREIETATEGFDFTAALGALQRAAQDHDIVILPGALPSGVLPSGALPSGALSPGGREA